MSKKPIVIVGAGPAGATAAYHIDDHEVLILDRREFPREKPCGGGLVNSRDWHRTFRNFAEIKDQLAVHPAENITMYWNERPLFSRTGHIFDHVRRAEFDHLLLKAALRKDNVAFRRFSVSSIERRDGNVILSNGREEIVGTCVVGCDGWNSVVSRHIGNTAPELKKRQYGKCLEYDVVCDPVAETHIMFCWRKEMGYAWVFPTSTGCYVGIISIGPNVRSLRTCLKELVTFCVDRGIISENYSVRDEFGAPDPIHVPRSYVSGNDMLLAGDAMGLVKQLTGEGIFFAMLSGMIAGEVIQRGGEIAFEYARRIKTAISEVTFLRNVPPRAFMMPALRTFVFFLQHGPFKEQLQDEFLNALCRRHDLPAWSSYRPFGSLA